MLPVATLALAALLLSGCVPEEAPPTAAPTPSSTPVFASEEDALAAAEAAYAEFQDTSDSILAEGGSRPERIDAVATGEAASTERQGFSEFSAKGYRSVGKTTFDNVQLESFDPANSSSTVRVYLCSDVSGVDVLDGSGVSVVAPTRPSRTSFEVGFDFIEGSLLVSSKDVWTGGGICE